MESPHTPVKQPGSATKNLSADTFEVPADPNVLIYSHAINMAIERLGDTLATQIGSAMSTVAASIKEMIAALKTNNDTCRYILLLKTPVWSVLSHHVPVLRAVLKVRHLCCLEGLHPHIPVQRGGGGGGYSL